MSKTTIMAKVKCKCGWIGSKYHVLVSSEGFKCPKCEAIIAVSTFEKMLRLTKYQNKILGWILDGAEIQVTQMNDKLEYDIVFESGDTEQIKKGSFEALRNMGLIKLKYSPSIDAERWA